ncbi:TPA: hypothetical protein HA231_05015 [Candidatus Woesearchaeota archaeon]|nr:hypothetical protein [Candidatus Woesearchaeota archaeon]
MTIDKAVTEPLICELKGLGRRLSELERDHFPGHIYAKRTIVIATVRVDYALSDPTKLNIALAERALQQAAEVFVAVDVLVKTGSLALIKYPLEDGLEAAYISDFPQSSLASRIREGHYMSF